MRVIAGARAVAARVWNWLSREVGHVRRSAGARLREIRADWRKCDTLACRGSRVLLATAGCLVFMASDPFGLGGATSRLSQDVALRALGPFYPTGESPISIVLVDDKSLDVLQRDYVLSYDDWRELLDAVSCAGPKAVFIDLIFLRPHEGYDRLPPELLELLARDGSTEPRDGCVSRAPIFVADLVEGELPSGFASTGNARELRLRSLTTPVNWEADDRSYPLWAEVKDETADWGRLPRARRGTWAGRCGNFVPYPALLLYLQDRGKIVPSGEGCVSDLLASGRMDDSWPPLPVGAPRMVVSWGYFPAVRPLGFDDMVADPYCDQYKSSEYTDLKRFVTSLSQLLMDFFQNSQYLEKIWEPKSRQPCLYFPAISAWKVLVDAFSIPEHATEARASPLRLLFENRFVLIGSHVTAAHDSQVSPIHGQIPGVFMHAMALDNLLRNDSRVWRPPPTFWEGYGFLPSLGWDSIVEWAMILCIVLVNHLLSRHGHGKLFIATVGALMSIGVATFTALVLLWSPINWAGVILFSTPDLVLMHARHGADTTKSNPAT